MAELELYSYQEEVVQRALQGENIIIWLPTGGGKTRTAVYVAQRHLQTKPRAKVVVLVNMLHLVEQHCSKEFGRFLGKQYKVLPVTGDSAEKDFFGNVLRDSDVIVCTAQILYNSMINAEEDQHVELSDITLLIIDECHHTHNDAVYNKIMSCYVEKKMKNQGPLPQILGLTASPGTGGKKTLETAVEHVLTICANMDSAIVSTKKYVPELKLKVPRPHKEFKITEKRPVDPLGDHIKGMMLKIHEFLDLPRDVQLRERGTQEYEQDVVELEKRAGLLIQREYTMVRCADHLRQYNDALLIKDTLRMIDAYNSLRDFYMDTTPMDENKADVFLVELFKESQNSKLQSTLVEQFVPKKDSRGILFTETRKSAHCLYEWILENAVLQGCGINAAILIGAGNSNMTQVPIDLTQKEQGETIRNFRSGSLNLLIATSIAEEGLDIPECNFVVRYGLLTNDIAQLQASGLWPLGVTSDWWKERTTSTSTLSSSKF
uniref:DEXH (Asp-Glu-X-His) box polypeptide 58 n=1 Tax=Neogobius melanostomus TaxID=47308 RepID=A0A8C6SH14_9GOBI